MKIGLSVVVIMILAVIAWIDHKTMEIPDTCNLAIGICGVLAMFVNPEISIYARMIGAVCISVPMLIMIHLIPGSFGGGDVKLTFAAGLYLGFRLMLVGTFLAFMIGGCQAMILLVMGKAKVGDGVHMAFGPALCMGFAAAMLVGNELLSWYLNLFW